MERKFDSLTIKDVEENGNDTRSNLQILADAVSYLSDDENVEKSAEDENVKENEVIIMRKEEDNSKTSHENVSHDISTSDREMGGHDIRLVIQKIMTRSDDDKGQNRLSIPVNQVREKARDFLTDQEKETLDGYKSRTKKLKIDAILIEPELPKDCSITHFRKWDLSSSSSYVLNNSWTQVKLRNGLKAGVEVQVWSFRVGKQLGFAIVNLSRRRTSGERNIAAKVDDKEGLQQSSSSGSKV